MRLETDLTIEGLVATTSTWQREQVRPDLIEERVCAYGEVLGNLRKHAAGYPDASTLLPQFRSGRPSHGMQGVAPGQHTAASDLIIAAVDKAAARPGISGHDPATDGSDPSLVSPPFTRYRRVTIDVKSGSYRIAAEMAVPSTRPSS